jgi:two-component system response regulator AtoC
MPGSDGLAVLQAARKTNPAVYVVIITGFATLDSAIQAVRLGAYDYLTKPFSLGQIDVIVRRILDRLALDAENRIGERTPVDLSPAMAVRLDSIEARLARLESLLRELIDRREGTRF